MQDTTTAHADHHNRAIATWLLAMAGVVFAMIVIGGLTRLTHSGLSMVDWRPITGWLPPLSDAEWRAVFEEYRRYPQYQQLNAGMTVDEFRGIFWLEYIHRLWGRLIGVAFALPLIFFLVRGWVDRYLAPRLVILFVLGGLQGVLGWYMVKSGLVDRPDVSQYRLVAHFGAALVIYVALLWVAFRLMDRAGGRPNETTIPARLRHGAWVIAALVTLTALSGGFVAGLDAGFAYNTFPLMDGELIPEHLLAMTPWWINFFEDVTTVQFVHRVLALTTAAIIVAFWLRVGRAVPSGRARIASHVLLVAVAGQIALGVSTLLLIVPVPLASAHQAGAVILLTAAVWTIHTMTPALAETAAARPVGQVRTARGRVTS